MLKPIRKHNKIHFVHTEKRSVGEPMTDSRVDEEIVVAVVKAISKDYVIVKKEEWNKIMSGIKEIKDMTDSKRS